MLSEWEIDCVKYTCIFCDDCDDGYAQIVALSHGCPSHSFCNALGHCDGKLHSLFCISVNVYKFAVLTSCTVSVDSHYRSFDGFLYDFPGTCKYNLASSTSDNTAMPAFQTFSKSKQQKDANGNHPIYLELHVYNHVVRIGKNLKTYV